MMGWQFVVAIGYGMQFAVLGYVLAVLTWLFYLAIMHVMKVRHDLHPVAKAHAYVLMVIGLALDLVLNIVVGTVAFSDLPREWLLTSRLKRYKMGRDGWRKSFAYWICEHLLNQFDEGHC
jgi:hypothetical protein